MSARLSANTQAILLLTAPLIAGRGKPSTSPLGVGEYRRLARRLRELERQPADLLDSGWREILKECRVGLDHERLERLLGRGLSPQSGDGTLADTRDLGQEPGGRRLPSALEEGPWRGGAPGALRLR